MIDYIPVVSDDCKCEPLPQYFLDAVKLHQEEYDRWFAEYLDDCIEFCRKRQSK